MPHRDIKRFAVPSMDTWQRIRAIFVEDWGLKLLALAITLVLWFMVSGRIVEREILVEPRLEGRPAPTFEVGAVVVSPTKIKIQGPLNRLNELDKMLLPISVEGRRESFDIWSMPLPIADRNIRPLTTVNVHVTIVAASNATARSINTN